MVAEPHAALVVIVDPHSIFRLGMATCLESLPLIGSALAVDSAGDAWERADLATTDLLIVDAEVPDLHSFLHDVRVTFGTPALVTGSGWAPGDMATVIDSGAIGVLAKETLTPATLEANVRAALNGAAVFPSELMGGMVGAPHEGMATTAGTVSSQLSVREQQVLRLIADGHATREVAAELCYSERTIKNVLHDVATKLGARSRSHAVAHAVREGLI
jgi:DNA-binding NarL/FixJ family response regulator